MFSQTRDVKEIMLGTKGANLSVIIRATIKM